MTWPIVATSASPRRWWLGRYPLGVQMTKKMLARVKRHEKILEKVEEKGEAQFETAAARRWEGIIYLLSIIQELELQAYCLNASKRWSVLEFGKRHPLRDYMSGGGL